MSIGSNETNGFEVIENSSPVGLYFDLYSDAINGDPVLVATDPKSRVILSPSGWGIPTEISSGQEQIALAGTPQPLYLGASGTVASVRAWPNNTGSLFLQAQNQFVLEPGDEQVVTIKDTQNINIDGEVTGDGYCWMTESDAEEYPSVPMNFQVV